MTEKEFFIGVITGEIKDKERYEHTVQDYDPKVHGRFCHFVLINSKGSILREVYNRDWVYVTSMWLMHGPVDRQYKKN